MLSIPRFLCPALSRSLRTVSRKTRDRKRPPIVRTIDALEAYVREVQKKVTRQSQGTKHVVDDADLSTEDINAMYHSLSAPQSVALPKPRPTIPLALKVKLGLHELPQDWSLEVDRLISNGHATTLRAIEIQDLIAAMPRSQRADAGSKLMSASSREFNTYCYDLVMDSYAASGRVAETLTVFDLVRKAGLTPSLYSYAHLMKAFAMTNDLEKAMALYQYLKDNKIEPNLVIHTTVMLTCIRNNKIDEAFKIFDTLKFTSLATSPDVQIYSLMIYACSLDSSKSAERASDLLEEMKAKGLQPTKETYNALLHVYASRAEWYTESWRIADQMQLQGIEIDKFTWHALLKSCARARDITRARALVKELQRLGDINDQWAPDSITYQLLFRAYANAKVKRSLNPLESDGVWVDGGITDTSVLYESRAHLEVLRKGGKLSTKLIDAYLTIPSTFSYPQFLKDWETIFVDHRKSSHSFKIALECAYRYRDLNFLHRVWKEREGYTFDEESTRSATVVYINALARCNAITESSDILRRASALWTFSRDELRCFQTKSEQLESEVARRVYRGLF